MYRKTTLTMIGLCLAGFEAQASTIVKTDVTAALGPDFFFDTAATGGGQINSNVTPAEFIRDIGVLPAGTFGTLLTIKGVGWASPAGTTTATAATVTITYLGSDNVLGGGDDIVVGSRTDNLTFAGAGEYSWSFSTPISKVVTGTGTKVLIKVVDNNNIAYKGANTATVENVKLSLAGTATGNEVADTDSDGLPDAYETNTGTYVSPTDTGTDPNNPDSDGDNLLDGDEVAGDPVTLYTSDPNKADTDADGINDDIEISGSANTAYGNQPTDPATADTDLDGLSDSLEINTHGTNPNLADTDDDGLSDGDEVLVHLTNPLSEFSDSDTLPDGWEIANGLDPNDGTGDNGDGGDPDNDNLLNIDEYHLGVDSSDPQDSDSDNDGLNDGFEWTAMLGLNNRDTDGDGLGDKFEVDNGLDPFSDADFDADTYSDFDEVMLYGSDPKDINSFPGDGTAPAVGSLTPIVKYGTVTGGEVLPLPPMPGDPASLNTAVINDVIQGGNDVNYGNGITNFTAVYSDVFPAAGTPVSITGFSWVVNSVGNTDADIRVEFYDPETNDGDPDFDGVDTEKFLGFATGTFTLNAPTGVYYWAFDAPVNFTSAGKSLAVRILGTEAMRLKVYNFGPNGAVRGIINSNQGDGPMLIQNQSGINFTLFGTPSPVVDVTTAITGVSRDGNNLTIDFVATAGSPPADFTVTGSPDMESGFSTSGVTILTPVAESAPGVFSVVLDVSANGPKYFFRIEN